MAAATKTIKLKTPAMPAPNVQKHQPAMVEDSKPWWKVFQKNTSSVHPLWKEAISEMRQVLEDGRVPGEGNPFADRKDAIKDNIVTPLISKCKSEATFMLQLMLQTRPWSYDSMVAVFHANEIVLDHPQQVLAGAARSLQKVEAGEGIGPADVRRMSLDVEENASWLQTKGEWPERLFFLNNYASLNDAGTPYVAGDILLQEERRAGRKTMSGREMVCLMESVELYIVLVAALRQTKMFKGAHLGLPRLSVEPNEEARRNGALSQWSYPDIYNPVVVLPRGEGFDTLSVGIGHPPADGIEILSEKATRAILTVMRAESEVRSIAREMLMAGYEIDKAKGLKEPTPILAHVEELSAQFGERIANVGSLLNEARLDWQGCWYVPDVFDSLNEKLRDVLMRGGKPEEREADMKAAGKAVSALVQPAYDRYIELGGKAPPKPDFE